MPASIRFPAVVQLQQAHLNRPRNNDWLASF